MGIYFAMTTAPCLESASAPDVYYLFPKGFKGNDQERYATINCRRSTSSRSNHLISFSGEPVPQLPCLQCVPHQCAYYCGNLVLRYAANQRERALPAYDHKDRFVERQPRTTAQSIGLIMVDLVKYYAVFPILPAFMEWGRKGYLQTQVMEGYS
ncbi:hypothetical protein EJB05_22348, partial [Eragrostis curvula]